MKKKEEKNKQESNKDKYEKEKKIIFPLLASIKDYPIAVDFSKKEEAKKKLIKIYKRSDIPIKGMILSYVNEKLGFVQLFREFESVSNMSFKYKQNIPPSRVTKSVLEYFNSLDGIIELIDLLSKFEDEAAYKLITYHLTRYLNGQTLVYRLLTNKCLIVLEKSNSLYVLNFFINLANVSNGTEIAYTLKRILEKWKEKLEKMNIKDKKIWLSLIKQAESNLSL